MSAVLCVLALAGGARAEPQLALTAGRTCLRLDVLRARIASWLGATAVPPELWLEIDGSQDDPQSAEVRLHEQAGLARLRRGIAEQAPAPAWSDQVPYPRAGWLRWAGLVSVLLLAGIWWLPSQQPAPKFVRQAPVQLVPTERTREPASRATSVAAGEAARLEDPANTSVPQAAYDPPPRSVPPLAAEAPPPTQVRSPAPARRARSAAPEGTRATERHARGAIVDAVTPDEPIEMRELAQAERLLSSVPLESLRLVREGQRRHARGYFAEERRYVEVIALIALGRSDEARMRAATFYEEYPRSAYRRRIQAALAPFE